MQSYKSGQVRGKRIKDDEGDGDEGQGGWQRREQRVREDGSVTHFCCLAFAVLQTGLFFSCLRLESCNNAADLEDKRREQRC